MIVYNVLQFHHLKVGNIAHHSFERKSTELLSIVEVQNTDCKIDVAVENRYNFDQKKHSELKFAVQGDILRLTNFLDYGNTQLLHQF